MSDMDRETGLKGETLSTPFAKLLVSPFITSFHPSYAVTMQAQATSTNSEVKTLSSSASLLCVQTLLRAGLGCIAYLRGLLPFENFSEYHLSAQVNKALSTSPSASSSTNQTQQTISGVTVMNLKRGFTNEGDKILDYLEHGIFEAIEKHYLRRFIFAIYLDSNDPNNIVEAYTFNFRYHNVPGTDTVVPVMSLGDQLSKMSLGQANSEDLMSDAIKRGKPPTLGEVKRSLKAMIKTLVTTISHMESLPKCRFGNFKLFFNENTPDDYQPPYFREGDIDSHRWYFTTHKTGEVPERTSIGAFETGWHGVNMRVISVSSYLPSVTEDNNATFTGITPSVAPKLTPVEEARLRAKDVEVQRTDASNRNVVWDADGDEDAQGEEVSEDGIILTRYNGEVTIVPIGVRGDDGSILPIPVHEPSGAIPELIYGGATEYTPTSVGRLIKAHETGETQPLPATQLVDMQSSPVFLTQAPIHSLPPSDVCGFTDSAISTQRVDTLALGERLRQRSSLVLSDKEMLDMETQEPPYLPSIETSSEPSSNLIKTNGNIRTCPIQQIGDEGKLACDCGTSGEDSCVLCDGGCKRWHHVWCMGFHGVQDERLPSQFFCFDCRLRRSREWDIIAGKIHADMLSRFKDLALFRRAVKIFEVHRPTTALRFREHLGCNVALVGQLLTRLEDEAFIAIESTVTDELGSSSRTQTKKGKKAVKSKAKKTQKELQKTRYVFLDTSKKTKAYIDYFNPDPQTEHRLMGLSNTKTTTHRPVDGRSENVVVDPNALGVDSQTQEPTQNVLTLAVARQAEVALKRKAGDDINEVAKKLKVSIGTGVDLCD